MTVTSQVTVTLNAEILEPSAILTIYRNSQSRIRKMKKKNLLYLISLIVVISTGIGSRVFQTGFSFFDKYLGDALYAVMVYLILSLLWAGGSALYKAWIVLVAMSMIETFQLTHIPLLFSRSENMLLKLAAILLGTQFSWLDLLAYLIGIVIISSLDQRMLPRTIKDVP